MDVCLSHHPKIVQVYFVVVNKLVSYALANKPTVPTVVGSWGGSGLWLLGLVICYRWHLTPKSWHMTAESWQLTTFLPKFDFKSAYDTIQACTSNCVSKFSNFHLQYLVLKSHCLPHIFLFLLFLFIAVYVI